MSSAVDSNIQDSLKHSVTLEMVTIFTKLPLSDFFLFTYVCGCLVSVGRVCRGQRRGSGAWNWSHKPLTWELGSKLRSSGTVASIRRPWAIPSGPRGVTCSGLMPEEARRGCRVLWNWIVSHGVGAGNWTKVFYKEQPVLSGHHWATSSAISYF